MTCYIKLKKSLTFLCILLLTAMMLFESCGKQGDKPVKLGFIVKRPEEKWFQDEWKGAQHCAEKYGFELVRIGATDGEKTLDGLKGNLFHITAQFTPAGAEEFGFTVRGVPITYNVAENTLSCKGKNAKLKLKDGSIKLELLVDRNSIEIFANDGRVYMPIGSILPEDNKSIELFTKGGKTKVRALEVYELNSAWR